MPRGYATDPADRMGVYKRLSDVPDQYRLHHHQTAYTGRDVWQEYVTSHIYPNRDPAEIPRPTERFGERWKAFMADRDRHHALATPADVEAWSQALTNCFALKTAADYWTAIERFYWWLLEHADHPHVHHPFLIAATEDAVTRDVWEKKLQHGRGGDDA